MLLSPPVILVLPVVHEFFDIRQIRAIAPAGSWNFIRPARQRLALTRWPDEIPGAGWRYGANLAYVKELVHYWQHQYDWRAQEHLLNGFPQYRVQLEDITLHYIHQPGVGPAPMPLLLSHG